MNIPAFVAGIKQTRKAILNGSAASVILAENADPDLTEPLQTMCLERGIPVQWISSMQLLGRSCGLSVGAAAVAVLTGENGFNRANGLLK